MLFQRVVLFLSTLFLGSTAALQLAPIDNLDNAWHVPATSEKREASFTGDLDLQDFESFFWGAPAGNKLVYANLTVYFPEQYRYVIAMERFAGKLKSVQCAEDMVLEFTNDQTFEYAKSVWNWVNQDVNHTFIMVTNYAGCADDMERLPFVVSNIRYDEAQNKAFLTADLKEWEEIAHSYTLNVGHMPLTPNHRMLMARGVLPRADFSMNLASSYDKNLFSTTVGGWTTSVDAVVSTQGSLNVDFDIDVSWFSLKSAAMTVTPEDVAASIKLALTERGTLAEAYNWQNTIISIPIEGIEIAKVVKLGAFLDVDVGFTMGAWTGEAVASLGAKMAIDNAAMVRVDLVDSGNNKFSGWTPTFEAIPLTLSAKVEGSAKVFCEPNVKLEASALGKGFNVGLNLQLPYVKVDFAATADSTGGVCGTDKTIGVAVDATVGVDLSVQAAKKGKEADPFWEQSLYSHEWPLFSTCLPFGPDAPTVPSSTPETIPTAPAEPSPAETTPAEPAITTDPAPAPPTLLPTPSEDAPSGPDEPISTPVALPTSDPVIIGEPHSSTDALPATLLPPSSSSDGLSSTPVPVPTSSATSEPAKDPLTSTAAPSKSTAASSKPTAASSKPTAASSKPTAASSKPTAASSKPTATPSKSTAVPPKSTAASSKSTAAPSKSTAAPSKSTAASSKSTIAPPSTLTTLASTRSTDSAPTSDSVSTTAPSPIAPTSIGYLTVSEAGSEVPSPTSTSKVADATYSPAPGYGGGDDGEYGPGPDEPSSAGYATTAPTTTTDRETSTASTASATTSCTRSVKY